MPLISRSVFLLELQFDSVSFSVQTRHLFFEVNWSPDPVCLVRQRINANKVYPLCDQPLYRLKNPPRLHYQLLIIDHLRPLVVNTCDSPTPFQTVRQLIFYFTFTSCICMQISALPARRDSIPASSSCSVFKKTFIRFKLCSKDIHLLSALKLLEVELFELRCSVVQHKTGSKEDYFKSGSGLGSLGSVRFNREKEKQGKKTLVGVIKHLRITSAYYVYSCVNHAYGREAWARHQLSETFATDRN